MVYLVIAGYFFSNLFQLAPKNHANNDKIGNLAIPLYFIKQFD